MPTRREREYYRMGFKDGVESERHRVRDAGGQIRYAEQEIREEFQERGRALRRLKPCLLYTSPSPRDGLLSRMPSSA